MPPYFNDRQKQKKSKALRLKIYGFFAVLLLLAVGSAYAVFYSGLFQIKNIDVDFSGGESIPAITNDLQIFFAGQSGLSSFLGLNNILNWKDGEITGNFLENYPQIESIQIQKYYFDGRIKLTIKERGKFGIWCLMTQNNAENNAEQRGSCMWFDKNGVVFSDAPDTEGGLVKKVEDFSGRQIKKGDIVLDSRFAGNLIKIFEVLDKSGLGAFLKLDRLEFQEITAVPAQSNFPEIYFSLRIDPGFGLIALQKLKEKGLENFSYIDLRVENRTYYK